MLKTAVIAGANALYERKSEIDALNVFPVPDGDTGTNMYLTALSAAIDVEKLPREATVHAVAKAAATGALRGARGNSGVILSQLFRGFAKGFEGMESASCENLASALNAAVETAYKAIMKPKEGTILTVARETAGKVQELHNEGVAPCKLFEQSITYGQDILSRTKEMLPALKAADVVDAGGMGFITIIEAAYEALAGRKPDQPVLEIADHTERSDEVSGAFRALNRFSTDTIEFAYDTEFFIFTDGASEPFEEAFVEYLDTMGDSIVTAAEENYIKVHVHTNRPGAVLEKALTIGALDRVKVENMRFQHEEKTAEAAAYKPTGFIAVAGGEGFKEIFRSLGADYVIEGGQTMNPSSEDFLNAIYCVPAKEIVVLPNNKNVILAARQAGELCKEKTIYVIPTRSMPQGLTALMSYIHDEGTAENAANMEDAINNIHTAHITTAVRSTVIDGISVTKGDAIGIVDGEVTLSHKNMNEAARRTAEKLITDDTSFVTIYYGEDAKPKDADKLMEYIKKRYPACEVEVQSGGQPVYRYILSAE
jgi:DAK2 domain fusion protein YloV